MRVYASDLVEAEMSQEDTNQLVEFFLANLDGPIEFVPEAWCTDPSQTGVAKAVYTVQRKADNRVIIVWPMRDDEGDFLYLTWEKECPWLDGLHEYGNRPESDLGV